MADNDSPLSKLLTTSSNSLNLEVIANFLINYVKFDEKTHDSVFLQSFFRANLNTNKILIVLLASKARGLLFDIQEGMSQLDIIKLDIMPTGSVKGTLKRLFDNHLIKKNDKGGYYVPNYSVDEVIDSIKNEAK